jgi:hypothetical protein
MIHLIDCWIHSLTQSPETQKREVTSRIAALGLSALVPVEAAFRCLDAALSVSAYVVFEPLALIAKGHTNIMETATNYLA